MLTNVRILYIKQPTLSCFQAAAIFFILRENAIHNHVTSRREAAHPPCCLTLLNKRSDKSKSRLGQISIHISSEAHTNERGRGKIPNPKHKLDPKIDQRRNAVTLGKMNTVRYTDLARNRDTAVRDQD